MRTSRRELFIDEVIHRIIFEDNRSPPFPCFTFMPKTGVSFHCVEHGQHEPTLRPYKEYHEDEKKGRTY